jgi:hypothetical protein
MGDDREEENHDGGVPWHLIMRQIAAIAERAQPHSAIVFTVTREELIAHFSERAAHYRSEIEELRTGNWEKLREKVIAVQGYQRMPGMPPIDTKAVESKLLAYEIEQARAKASLFDFAAKHLAAQPAFTVDLATAAHYEIIPWAATGIDLPNMGQARGVPGTLAPFA